MKKLVLILTLVCICAFAAPAFANPFSDVAADHWAYDAIDKLADDGIVVGNPDGTYKGNKTMTRYEMATLVARAMAASEADDAKISAENKALIDKLAAEFGSELDALGVRVTALENKVGNVKLTGVARIRMVNEDFDNSKDKNGNTDNNKYDMRIRLKATAQVNDNVTVNARFTTDNVNLEDDNGDNNNDARFDQYNVKYANKNLVAIVGRDDAWLGKGTIIDDNLLGAQLVVPFGNEKQFTFAAISGRLDTDDTNFVGGLDKDDKPIVTDLNLTAFELNGKVGKVGLGFDYGWVEAKKDNFSFDKNVNDEDKANVFGVNADYAFNDKVNVWAEYVKTDIKLNAANGNEKDDDAIFVGVNYQAHPRLALDLTYGCVGGASVVPGISTWTDGLDNRCFYTAEKADMWKVGVNYDLMKNVTLYADYWNVSCDGNTPAGQSDNDYQRIETGLTFKF